MSIASYRIIDTRGRTVTDVGLPTPEMTLEPEQRLSVRCRIQEPRQTDFVEMHHGSAVAVSEIDWSREGYTVLFIDIVGTNVQEVLELEHRMLEWAGMQEIPYNFQQQLRGFPTNLVTIWKRIKWLTRWVITGKQ